jgi:ParB family transcriptional regulator, chromosome partitioning protein
MASKPAFGSVALHRIDKQDHRYKITTGGPSEALVASIKRAGILTPPVLLPKVDDGLIIVSGFRRIEALGRLCESETIAWVLERAAAPERCIEIAILDNAAQRKMNPVEQGRAILLLETLYPDADRICQAAGELGIPMNPSVARKLRMAAQMNDWLQKALVEGDVALPVALQLADMADQSAAETITALIGAMGLGLNRQRELLDWLMSISRREKISMRTLLDEDQIVGVIENPDLDRKQKGHLLRDYFRRRRYPEMADIEARFRETVKSLHLGKGIRLEPPPYFEGMTYSLRIDFNDPPELLSRYQRLGKKMNSPAMASLWDLMRMR